MANKAKIFLTKMVEVLKDENTTLLSDNDLFYLINDMLPRKHRISMSYFEFLKSPNQDNPRSISSNQTMTEEEKEDFIAALRVGRIKQKMNLTRNALDDKTRNAYPNLWMLERKNTELQLKQTVSLGMGNITLQVEGADTKLIDTIDVDWEEAVEVEPEPILITKKGHNDED